MPESVLVELLQQTNYIDELECFATIDVTAIPEHALETVHQALTTAMTEIDSALKFDSANDVEYEDVFGADVISILGSLASRIGEIQHRTAVLHNT